MDYRRFDEVLRSLSSPTGRRSLLARLAASVLALTSGAAVAAASRKCKPRCGVCERCQKGSCKKKKSGKKRCKPGRCRPTPNDTPCNTGGICQEGRCLCPPGTEDCGGVCVNTDTDPRNCGACGVRCQLNAFCEEGACTCVAGTCSTPGATCCPDTGGIFTCICNEDNFTDPTTCNGVPSCPAGTTQCVGPVCQACCPSGSTCDTTTGTCLQ